MIKHFNVRVIGVVQGVFFRASTKEKADDLGVKGFVKNETDGSVYIEAEGEEDVLEKFIMWCRTGPPRASVEHLEVVEGPVTTFARFEIKRW